MPKLTNSTDQPITTHTGHSIPANGSLTVSATTLDNLVAQPFIARHLRGGSLVVSADPSDRSDEITRSTIAKANRRELLEIIIPRSEWTEADLIDVTVDGRDGEDGLRDMAVHLALGPIV